MDMKSKVAKMKLENTELKGRVGKLESTVNETKRDMRALLEKINQLET